MVIAVQSTLRGSYYHRQVAKGVLDFAALHSDVELCFPGNSILGARNSITPDGAIVLLATTARKMAAQGMRVVSVSSKPAKNVPRVCSDNRAIVHLVIEHFKARNFQTLAMIDVANAEVSRSRRKAFAEICVENGFVPHVMTIRDFQDLRKENQQLVDSLRQLRKPAGIMLISDEFAPHLFRLCNQLDIRVPDDVAVVGINNTDNQDSDAGSSLCSVDINAERIGYHAADMLARIVRGETVPHATFIPPRELVVRRSADITVELERNVRQALNYIQANLHQNIEFEDILRQQELGRRALEKRFQKYVGTSPMKHLRGLRLDKAKFLLTTTKLSVKDICKQCGFVDSNYLCRLFRQKHGTTPLQYRKNASQA